MSGYFPENHLRKLEDKFNSKDIPVFCRLLEESIEIDSVSGMSNPEKELQIIFPMKDQDRIFSILRDLKPFIEEVFYEPPIIRAATIVKYLAYDVFSQALSEAQGYFVSTTVRNQMNPVVKTLQKRIIYHYQVDVGAIGATKDIVEGSGFEQCIKMLGKSFNESSRYLKIERLRVGFSSDRLMEPRKYKVVRI